MLRSALEFESPVVTLRGAEPDPDASLDPADWEAFKDLAHRLLEDVLEHLRTVPERAVWRPVPAAVRQALAEPLPFQGQGLERTWRDARELILPYPTGNTHPRFWGWVHGAGTAGGVLAELIAAAINANCGGRDHGAIYVERQVIEWCRQLFDFPEGTSGILVSGTSMATLIGLAVARHHLGGVDVRTDGIRGAPALVGYASAEAHGSVARAFEILGLGRKALRLIPVDSDYRIELEALRARSREDRAEGARRSSWSGPPARSTPARSTIWRDSPTSARRRPLAARRRRIRRADRAQRDPEAAPCRDRARGFPGVRLPQVAARPLRRRLRAGAPRRPAPRGVRHDPDYLRRDARGLAGGDPWFCDYGPELSRGFRALKVWFTLKEHGTRRLGAAIERNCEQARYLAARIAAEPRLELMAPVALNIVCFRLRAPGLDEAGLDRLNAEIVADLQESGVAAPSTTTLGGRTAIRVCLTNHRTRQSDLDLLIDAVLTFGERRAPDADGAGDRHRAAGKAPGPRLHDAIDRPGCTRSPRRSKSCSAPAAAVGSSSIPRPA